MTDLLFIGPIVGGLLALGGTLYLAFSANKRESIAAAERTLMAWYRVAQLPPRKRETSMTFPSGPGDLTTTWVDVPADWTDFITQGPYLWGDEEALHEHTVLSGYLQDRASMDSETFRARLKKLQETATKRLVQYRRVIEDMRRRSAWTFIRMDFVDDPGKYRFSRLK